MPTFVLNKNVQINGDYEVHNTTTGCSFMPLPQNQINLGYHLTCREAVAFAKSNYNNARINGCYYCATPCHTT